MYAAPDCPLVKHGVRHSLLFCNKEMKGRACISQVLQLCMKKKLTAPTENTFMSLFFIDKLYTKKKETQRFLDFRINPQGSLSSEQLTIQFQIKQQGEMGQGEGGWAL